VRYKIGDVAKILGISTDLIRYYEEKGVVTPQKDRNNRYRYYDAWDVNFLIDCLWYKKMGFGISEISQMSNVESYSDLVGHLTTQGDNILEQIQYQNLLLERMRALTEAVVRVKDFLGVCDIRNSKEFVYYLNRRNDTYDSSPVCEKLNNEWNKYMPFTKRLFIIDEDGISGRNDDYMWGFSISKTYAKKFDVSVESPVTRYRPKLCVHSAFKSYGKDGFTARHLDFMCDFARKNNLKIKGTAFGNLICSVPEDGKITGYFEAWLPVSQK
jgi:DNA-binding transcriptional MerR regulator